MLIGILDDPAGGRGFAAWCGWQPQATAGGPCRPPRFRLDLAGALRLGLLEIVFVFLFVDLFDNIGTLVAVGKKAGLFDRAHQIPRVNRILFADATATVVGSLPGTSTVVSYIESAAGVVAGGRSGVTAIVVGLAVRGGPVRRAGAGRHPGRGHRARADHRRHADDGARRRDRLDQTR